LLIGVLAADVDPLLAPGPQPGVDVQANFALACGLGLLGIDVPSRM
jgi:hypothetical protein